VTALRPLTYLALRHKDRCNDESAITAENIAPYEFSANVFAMQRLVLQRLHLLADFTITASATVDLHLGVATNATHDVAILFCRLDVFAAVTVNVGKRLHSE